MSVKNSAIYPASPATTRGTSTKISAHKDKVIYTNGKSVIIRSINDPSIATVFSGHVHNTTVARISPSGYYCASADISGTVKVWDTVGEDQTLKGEYRVISGRINDLEWDGESKRIIAVGDGREKFGHPFMFDTGTSTGEISGHSKTINAVAIRHQRPFRAATAADDALIVFHQGAPYKFLKMIKTHKKFVQDVRYAPSGDHFASVGSDSKIFIYDGKTGETQGEISDHPHKGSIMACAWSPDNRSLVTSSADCTVKLWDVETQKSTTTWTLGAGVAYQQVGNTWSGAEDIVSLSISGALNIFDRRTGDKPARIINGPQKAITSLAPTSSGTFLAGTADGRIISYVPFTGEASTVSGEGHTTLVSGLASTDNGKTYSIGFDDRVRESDGTSFVSGALATSSQPKSISIGDDDTVFIAEMNCVEAVRSNQKVFELPTKFSPSSIASGSIVAVGGEDLKVHLYDWDGKTLKETAVLEGNKGIVSAVAFSPDGNFLAAGDSSGKIVLFEVKERKIITSRWFFHTARISSLNWTADGQHCASGSLDTHIYIWSVQKPMKNIAIKNAGLGGVNSVLWVGENMLASAGADACVKIWEVQFHV